MDEKGLTRRGFLKGAAAATALIPINKFVPVERNEARKDEFDDEDWFPEPEPIEAPEPIQVKEEEAVAESLVEEARAQAQVQACTRARYLNHPNVYNPNGVIYGDVGTFFYDTMNEKTYICTKTGTSNWSLV